MNMNITCVTGYWYVKNKHDEESFIKWFETSLKVNNPYVVFSNKEGIEIIKKYRKDIPTYYIELNIEDFYMQKYKDKMTTDNFHCPSIELNMIWNEKILLLQKAYKLNPFNSDFFCWIDAGICIYRNRKPPSKPFNVDKINKLPTDKIIYSSSQCYNEELVSTSKPYHHISGTSYIIHKNIIDKSVDLYIEYCNNCIAKNNIWTDQVIWTHIYKDNINHFYKLSDGYGSIIKELF